MATTVRPGPVTGQGTVTPMLEPRVLQELPLYLSLFRIGPPVISRKGLIGFFSGCSSDSLDMTDRIRAVCFAPNDTLRTSRSYGYERFPCTVACLSLTGKKEASGDMVSFFVFFPKEEEDYHSRRVLDPSEDGTILADFCKALGIKHVFDYGVAFVFAEEVKMGDVFAIIGDILDKYWKGQAGEQLAQQEQAQAQAQAQSTLSASRVSSRSKYRREHRVKGGRLKRELAALLS